MVFFLSRRQLIFASLGLLLAYWGVLEAFGDLSLENNAVRKLDLLLFGANHLYTGDGLPFDPEGFLSTFPAVVNTLAGYLAGLFLIEKQKEGFKTLAYLLIAGAGLAALAYFWDFVFPVNKKLWTSSYVVLTVGLDLMLMGIIFYFTDLAKQTRSFRFFDILGKNPLAIYLLSEYLAISMLFIRVGEKSLYAWVYQHAFSWIGPYWGSLAFAVAFMLLCWAFGWWLDKRKIYIRV